MKPMDQEMQQWIAAHAADDPMRLRLRHHGDPDIETAILQIECRRKAAGRLPEALACSGFMFPTALSSEQATSEPIAAIHADIAGYRPGSRHLDLTCGLAIDAFEAARRGASVTAIDITPAVAAAAAHNAEALGLADRFTAIEGDSCRFVAETTGEWDTIFIDPARRGDNGRRLRAIADCAPDAAALMPRLLQLAPRVIVKASPMLDISAVAAELDAAAASHGAVTRMIAIGTARECKEIVAVVERGAAPGAYVTEAITALPSGETRIFTSASAAPHAPCIEGLPAAGHILYEPYPAVMKAAPWGALGALDPSLRKLHPNTHLFTSPEPIAAFPGRAMPIERAEPLADKALKAIARTYPKINVAARNFVLQAPELARRLKVKEGGDMIVYGARCGAEATPALITARMN